jgi:putative phosphoribosyl transferase
VLAAALPAAASVAIAGFFAPATATVPVRVTMLEFLRRRITRLHHLHIERQVDAGERVIRIEQHLIPFDGADRDNRRRAIMVGAKLVADLEFAIDREQAAGNALHLRRIVPAVSLGRFDLDARLGPGRNGSQLFVESVDNLTGTFEIGDGLGSRRGVKHVASRIPQGVVKGDDAWHVSARRERRSGEKASHHLPDPVRRTPSGRTPDETALPAPKRVPGNRFGERHPPNWSGAPAAATYILCSAYSNTPVLPAGGIFHHGFRLSPMAHRRRRRYLSGNMILGLQQQFIDRVEAGRMLADHLKKYSHRLDTIVLALPPGGVPVGLEIAHALNAAFDVFGVRKLELPELPGRPIGAITSSGTRMLDEVAAAEAGLGAADLARLAHRAQAELQQQELRYRRGRRALNITDRIVVLVDEGIATGFLMHAAVIALHQLRPAWLVVAAPVGAAEACEDLLGEVHELVCPVRLPQVPSVGLSYEQWPPVSDDDIQGCLHRGRGLPRL